MPPLAVILRAAVSHAAHDVALLTPLAPCIAIAPVVARPQSRPQYVAAGVRSWCGAAPFAVRRVALRCHLLKRCSCAAVCGWSPSRCARAAALFAALVPRTSCLLQRVSVSATLLLRFVTTVTARLACTAVLRRQILCRVALIANRTLRKLRLEPCLAYKVRNVCARFNGPRLGSFLPGPALVCYMRASPWLLRVSMSSARLFAVVSAAFWQSPFRHLRR